MRTHCVYVLRDPRTGEARYVGETYDRKYRYKYHVGATTIATRDWVLELRRLGLVPTMHVVQQYLPTRSSSLAAEREWIRGLLKAGANLLNVKDTPTDSSNIARRYASLSRFAQRQTL
jgi:hypothetical protein